MSTRATAPSAEQLAWFKSSYSAGNGGDCVEVAATEAAVHIRDSKRSDGPVLHVGSTQWTAFVQMAARS
ncbi:MULTISPECIES: DUF397 domain-containing protein [Streptomyces]|uniref:DUF397 domain-containing protein n=1 Tax=Streptomyces lycii TaxID=2654337 RepID=A0ABQ7FA39_9ACTN|nr:DUF397 domain-containing protein [Streptomyces lycii]KAF4405362.1 DUF397 domain-containing protein [Streptomyces lycii]